MTKKDLIEALKEIRNRAQKTIDNEDCQYDVLPAHNAMMDMQKIATQALKKAEST